MRKLLLLSLTTVLGAHAQLFSVGVLGGAPFTDVVNKNVVNGLQSIPKSNNFTVGPAFRVNLPASLRIEVDALYRPYDFSLGVLGSSTQISATQWRFPVLLQYRFGTPIVKPFVEGGLSFEHLQGLSTIAQGFGSGHQSDASVVLGGGVDVKIPFFKISGELRYTRQSVSYFANISNLNQAEVLLGIHF